MITSLKIINKGMIIMFSYIEIIGNDLQHPFMGFVDYEFKHNVFSMTLVRGMRRLSHIIIPLSEVTDIKVERIYGADRISFTCDSKEYVFINTGFGENDYLIDHVTKATHSNS